MPHAIVLRSRTERMRTLDTIRATLAGVALATVALAAVLSYSLARTVTKPLATITAHMRDVAATGDLTRKIGLPDTAWNDEDAVLWPRPSTRLPSRCPPRSAMPRSANASRRWGGSRP